MFSCLYLNHKPLKSDAHFHNAHRAAPNTPPSTAAEQSSHANPLVHWLLFPANHWHTHLWYSNMYTGMTIAIFFLFVNGKDEIVVQKNTASKKLVGWHLSRQDSSYCLLVSVMGGERRALKYTDNHYHTWEICLLVGCGKAFMYLQNSSTSCNGWKGGTCGNQTSTACQSPENQ